MKSLRLLPLLLCFLFALSPTAAQETADIGWPIEERCLAEPTLPPHDWTFPGAILMTGHYGIHALSADIPTPYVVTFIPSVPSYDSERINRVLSPDNRWYATTNATVFNGGLWVVISVYEIIVYSTVTPHESYTMPWTSSLDGYLYTPRWIDNQHLIYPSPGIDRVYNEYRPEETYSINPFTQEIKADGQVKINPFPEDSFFAAPDWTRAVYETQWFDIGWNAGVDWGVYDFISGDKLASLPFTLKRLSIAWSPDSLKFVALAGEWEQNQQILLIDREGQNREIILNVPPDLVSDYTTEGFNWSADSRYLFFRVGTKSLPRSYELYIADVEDERIFKTCIDASSGLASSPDGKLLAMMSNGYGQRPVMVLDIDAWALHTVAYHNGSVIGWRGD